MASHGAHLGLGLGLGLGLELEEGEGSAGGGIRTGLRSGLVRTTARKSRPPPAATHS
jgi:hypothetical protein